MSTDSKPESHVWSWYNSENIFMNKIYVWSLIILADVFFDCYFEHL